MSKVTGSKLSSTLRILSRRKETSELKQWDEFSLLMSITTPVSSIGDYHLVFNDGKDRTKFQFVRFERRHVGEGLTCSTQDLINKTETDASRATAKLHLRVQTFWDNQLRNRQLINLFSGLS